jgi:hypothetical protein
MPHLVRFKNGDEFKAMTRRGRRVHRFRPGERARIKRAFGGNGGSSRRKSDPWIQ